jgi:hypothetical protein
MSMEKIHEPAGQAAARSYRGYGLFGGAAAGLFAGVLISGPHFEAWSASASLALVLACAAVGALMGWLFLSIVSGSVAGGGAWGAGDAGGGDASGVGGHGGGGDDGGDA